jgi:hypothetical protein
MKQKKPPRTVWILVTDDGKPCASVDTKKTDATKLAANLNAPRIATSYRAVKYVLAGRSGSEGDG